LILVYLAITFFLLFSQNNNLHAAAGVAFNQNNDINQQGGNVQNYFARLQQYQDNLKNHEQFIQDHDQNNLNNQKKHQYDLQGEDESSSDKEALSWRELKKFVVKNPEIPIFIFAIPALALCLIIYYKIQNRTRQRELQKIMKEADLGTEESRKGIGKSKKILGK